MKETLSQIIHEISGIVAAVAVAVALRWSARRWPLPGEDEGDDYPRPRRRRRSRRPDDDPLPEED